ncbi:MAG: hypothetical protein O7G31_06980 [Calditrichaeota bacterium]|nr:hypothetical protein [Calditrichota bacterium]
MKNVRRYYIVNAEYFITVVTKHRRNLFANEKNMRLLKATFRDARNRVPFLLSAFVFLPDRLHMWIRPLARPEDISAIVGIVKRTFAKSFVDSIQLFALTIFG